MGQNIVNVIGIFSFALVILQIINQLILLYSPIKNTLFTRKYFTWREIERQIKKIAKMVKESNVDYGIICGTGRGGGILGSMLSTKLNNIPVLVIDRKYVKINNTPVIDMFVTEVEINQRYKNIKDKPVLLITSQSDPGITLEEYKRMLIKSGFKEVHKCAILKSKKTLDVDIKYSISTYEPSTKCRKFPWTKKSKDIMEKPEII